MRSLFIIWLCGLTTLQSLGSPSLRFYEPGAGFLGLSLPDSLKPSQLSEVKVRNQKIKALAQVKELPNIPFQWAPKVVLLDSIQASVIKSDAGKWTVRLPTLSSHKFEEGQVLVHSGFAPQTVLSLLGAEEQKESTVWSLSVGPAPLDQILSSGSFSFTVEWNRNLLFPSGLFALDSVMRPLDLSDTSFSSASFSQFQVHASPRIEGKLEIQNGKLVQWVCELKGHLQWLGKGQLQFPAPQEARQISLPPLSSPSFKIPLRPGFNLEFRQSAGANIFINPDSTKDNSALLSESPQTRLSPLLQSSLEPLSTQISEKIADEQPKSQFQLQGGNQSTQPSKNNSSLSNFRSGYPLQKRVTTDFFLAEKMLWVVGTADKAAQLKIERSTLPEESPLGSQGNTQVSFIPHYKVEIILANDSLGFWQTHLHLNTVQSQTDLGPRVYRSTQAYQFFRPLKIKDSTVSAQRVDGLKLNSPDPTISLSTPAFANNQNLSEGPLAKLFQPSELFTQRDVHKSTPLFDGPSQEVLSVIPAEIESKWLRLVWRNLPAISRYLIQVKEQGEWKALGFTRQNLWKIENLKADSLYHFRVIPQNRWGVGRAESLQVRTLAPLEQNKNSMIDSTPAQGTALTPTLYGSVLSRALLNPLGSSKSNFSTDAEVISPDPSGLSSSEKNKGSLQVKSDKSLRFSEGEPTNKTPEKSSEGRFQSKSSSGWVWVNLPAGRYIRSDGTEIKIRSFQIMSTEVTQKDYLQRTGKNPSYRKGPALPVENISWTDAQAFCSDLGASLPTEAQWEFAARGGAQGDFYWGQKNPEIYAWYYKNSDNQTRAVGQKLPNNYGLYDMMGNVFEWTSTWFSDYTKAPSLQDPTGPSEGFARVTRGGSWFSDALSLKLSARFSNRPGSAHYKLGFRCARPLP